MAHVSAEELKRRLTEAAKHVVVSGTYVHFKSPKDTYIVKALGIVESSEEVAVVYEAQYIEPMEDGSKVTFIRPLSSWLAIVEHEGQSVQRFKRIG